MEKAEENVRRVSKVSSKSWERKPFRITFLSKENFGTRALQKPYRSLGVSEDHKDYVFMGEGTHRMKIHH